MADIEAPATAVIGRIVLTGEATKGDGSVNYDNASAYDKTLYGQAYNPNPADGATVTLALDDLSWQNHDTKDPNDVFSCDVYLEAEGDSIDPNFYSAPHCNGDYDRNGESDLCRSDIDGQYCLHLACRQY